MVKLGLIGYNEGNGHPYSFSAIINGYVKEYMLKSPYPVIYEYLEARPSSEIGITEMNITHIWCPDKYIANDISKCTNIPYVSDSYAEMTDYVDAVIIARDDVDSHYEIAKYFLEKGKFVFVDKPLCRNKDELDFFSPFLYEGKLMSCSGFRYKDEMRTSFYGKLKKEDILFINAFSVADWYKYAIHVLEAVSPIMGHEITRVIPLHQNDSFFAKIEYTNSKYLTIQINRNHSYGIKASFYCKNGEVYNINFDDNFGCFKYMLQEFHKMIITKKPVISPQETITIINAMIAGGENAGK
mgnify:CR=1 FL=1